MVVLILLQSPLYIFSWERKTNWSSQDNTLGIPRLGKRFSYMIIPATLLLWKLTLGMVAADVKDTWKRRLPRPAFSRARVKHRPRLLSYNGCRVQKLDQSYLGVKLINKLQPS